MTPADLGAASIPASGHITAMSASGSSALVGQQLNSPVYAGQVLVRQMLSGTPQLGAGEQVVGTLLKGDQMPGVALVAGDTVQVIAVPQPGQGSTDRRNHRLDAGRPATVYAVAPPPTEPDPVPGVGLAEVPRSDADTVTAYAAADQLGLSLVSEGPSELVALASIKGSPGVTTAAIALAASLAESHKVLLVEADPFGGDLAPRLG